MSWSASFPGALNPYERLVYLLRRWALDFQIREWETRVLILELYRNPKFYESQEYRNTRRFWKLIRSTVEAGQQSGHFRKDFEISYYLHLVQGAFEHEALARMMLSKKQPTIARHGTHDQPSAQSYKGLIGLPPAICFPFRTICLSTDRICSFCGCGQEFRVLGNMVLLNVANFSKGLRSFGGDVQDGEALVFRRRFSSRSIRPSACASPVR